MSSETEVVIERLFDRFPLLSQHHFLAFNLDAEPQIQEGPTCGLAALSMAAGMSQNAHRASNRKDLSALLHAAQELKMTLQGEMFSADNMAHLSSQFYQMSADVTKNMLLDPEKVITCLLQESPILVPYDKDKNNEPCVLSGHSAHWALVTGFVVPIASEYVHQLAQFAQLLNDRRQVWYVKQRDGRLNCLLTKSQWISHITCDLSQMYVFARHGRSRHLALWVLDMLAKSNSNIDQLDPCKSSDDFVMPEGGLSVGLKSKTVVIRPTKCEV